MTTTGVITRDKTYPSTLDEVAARAHVMEPTNLRGVVTLSAEDQQTRTAAPPPSLTALHLDVTAFCSQLHNALKDSVVGYNMELRRAGSTIATLEWNWAKTPVDGGLGFNLNRQMHIASVSKLMTGIGITRMINLLSGLALPAGFDTKIVDFLPDYWKKGWTSSVTAGLSKITFRHLLTHKAGFPADGVAMTFPLMKQRVANYSGTVGGATQYSNFNYSLCRILMPVLNGNIPASATFWPGLEDVFWDMNTISAYKKIMNESVFAPSGVINANLGHPTDAALAYRFPAGNEHGWDSGDLATSAGGDGWHMSVREVLNVMGTFRRSGKIVWNPALAQQMLDDDIGVDENGKVLTGAGRVYCKNGLWQDSVNGRTEQCVAYFLPEDMELVVFANSPILPKGSTMPLFFRSLVTNTYIANLK